jgi:hypothetical protein
LEKLIEMRNSSDNSSSAAGFIIQHFLDMETWTWLEYCFAGIDYDLAGNGGYKCLEYIEPFKRIVETIVALVISTTAICSYSLFATAKSSPTNQ